MKYIYILFATFEEATATLNQGLHLQMAKPLQVQLHVLRL